MSRAAKLDWLKFLTLIMGELRSLAWTLYQRHKGNVEEARAEIRYVGKHVDQLKNFEVEARRRMDELKARSADRERELAAAKQRGDA